MGLPNDRPLREKHNSRYRSRRSRSRSQIDKKHVAGDEFPSFDGKERRINGDSEVSIPFLENFF